MPKEYKFTKKTVTKVTVDNDCECDNLKVFNPCEKCDAAAWDAFHDGDGVVTEPPVDWEVM
jgi:hypothetical protein